ncbi:MAG: hypothetical protein A2137_01550, partial [Chloroflexi bacterium RBG_16_58_8]
EVLRRGVALGMTFLDTGEDYEDGYAEELLGKAIKGMREKVFISSKFQPAHNAFPGVMAAIEGSLKRLGTDYIDLYQVQWPNAAVPVTETMSALSALVKAGKVRFAGVSNFTPDQLREAQAAFQPGELVSVQTEYNLLDRSIESDLLPYCRENRVTVIAYNLLSQGHLYFGEKERDILEKVAEKHGGTVTQVIIAWVISRPPVIALTNTMDLRHLEQNAAAADLRLSQADINLIDATFNRQPVLVLPERIRVAGYDADVSHTIYTTLEEAIANAAGIQPSPTALAEEIKNGQMLRPVELVRTRDTSGRYDYDLIHGRVRYWAWVIAHGRQAPIPAFVAGERQYAKSERQ